MKMKYFLELMNNLRPYTTLRQGNIPFLRGALFAGFGFLALGILSAAEKEALPSNVEKQRGAYSLNACQVVALE